MTEHAQLLKGKLSEQEKVYQAFLSGDRSCVCHQPFQHSTYGQQDANYTKRLRLSNYLLFEHIDDEATIHALFQEELRDRQTNGFQGIGPVLGVLTTLLRHYNTDGSYDELFQKAKMANFDCAAGYDPSGEVDADLDSYSLPDCIRLAKDMNYNDVMGTLVDFWKATVTEWDDAKRGQLIRYNSHLGRIAENETIHKQVLASRLSGKLFDIASAYHSLIGYYIDLQNYPMAYRYLTELIGTYDLKEIRPIRLFAYFIEYALEIVADAPEFSAEVWPWAKAELKKRHNKFGNLYTKGIAAAKAMGDPYALLLESEYLLWKKRMKIKN